MVTAAPDRSAGSRRALGCASGKVILLGEHAVVFGQPGIAMPLPGCWVEARVWDEPQHEPYLLRARDLGLEHRFGQGTIPPELQALERAVAEIRQVRPELPRQGWGLEIRSTIPIARGLGSGAAVTVALVRGLDELHALRLRQEELLEIAFQVEKLHHGRPSGIDPTVIILARPLLFIRGNPPKPLPEPGLDLVVADTGRSQDTGEVVAQVAERRGREPERIDAIIQRIGDLTRQGVEALREEDPARLGRLMDRNQEQLAELGVSSPELDRLVEAARRAGALGAKLTGAGRGGCMLALAPDPTVRGRVRAALLEAGARRVITAGDGRRRDR